ncbi:MAG: methionine adenosyltransferase, partial [Desulfurococcaceae archaeon]
NKIYDELRDYFREVYVEIVSQIGKPIDQPLIASIRIVSNNKDNIPLNVVNDAKRIANEELENIVKITNLILENKVILY